MYVEKEYTIGVSLTPNMSKVLTIDVASNDDGDSTGVWVKTTNGSVYFSKDLLKDCLELIRQR